MSLNKCLIALAALLPVWLTSAAHAALITSAASLGSPNTTVTAFGPAGTYSNGYSEVIPGVNPLSMTYAGSSGLYVDYASGWGLGNNGSVIPGTPSIGVNQAGTLTFILQNGPISGFGFLMNYAQPGFGPVNLIALDASLTPFQTYDVSTLAPITSSTFQFRGVQDLTVDIYGFEFASTGNPSPLFDSISYTSTLTSQVPEPATLAVMLSGLGALGWIGRRRKRGGA